MTKQLTPCSGLSDLFFGPGDDERTEPGREARERRARAICINECEHRLACLERALVLNEDKGVWGGMTEAERGRFRTWLIRTGFKHIPSGDAFWDALDSFYRQIETDDRRRRKGSRVR